MLFPVNTFQLEAVSFYWHARLFPFVLTAIFLCLSVNIVFVLIYSALSEIYKFYKLHGSVFSLPLFLFCFPLYAPKARPLLTTKRWGSHPFVFYSPLSCINPNPLFCFLTVDFAKKKKNIEWLLNSVSARKCLFRRLNILKVFLCNLFVVFFL